jgi:hypothetical protein
MGWIAFTAVDLWIGLIILEAMLPTLPAEKAIRVKKARKVILGSIGVLALAFVGPLVKRWVAPR